MEKFFTAIGLGISGMALFVVGAVFSGTVLWIVWPYALPVVLPKLVSSGWIPAHLSWWTCVCFSWAWSLLFGSTFIKKSDKSN